MAPWVDIPLATGEGQALSPYASDAELINLAPIPNPPGSRRPFCLQTVPALVALGGFASGETRLLAPFGGKLLFVRNNELYYMAGTTHVLIGAVTIASRCRWVDADTHIVFTDGAKTYAATLSTVTEVVPPSGTFSDVAYMDGYTIYAQKDTNRVYASDLDDPTTVGALSFTTADSMGGVVIAVVADHRELVVFKESSTEFYYNSGSSGFPFTRSSPGLVERGCFSRFSVSKHNNQVFWLGDDLRVYAMHGYEPRVISSPWVQRIFSSGRVERSTTVGSAVTIDGRPTYLLSVLVASSTSYCMFYDIEAGLWYRRKFWDFAGGLISYAVNHHQHTTTGSNPVTGVYAALNSSTTNNVYRLDSSVFVEGVDGAAIETTVTLPAIDAGGSLGHMHELYLDAAKTTATTDINLMWSDDGGTTYTSTGAHTSKLSYARCRWHRLGSFRQRILRIVANVNGRVVIMAVRARVESGAA